MDPEGLSGRSTDRPVLEAAAAEMGVQTGYWDVRGGWHDVTDDALVAVLAATGGLDVRRVGPAAEVLERVRQIVADRRRRVVEPTVVIWQGAPSTFTLRLDPACRSVELQLQVDERAGASGASGAAGGAGGAGGASKSVRAVVDLPVQALAVGQRHGRRIWQLDLGALAASGGWHELPVGRHRLVVAASGGTPDASDGTATVLVAPRSVVHFGAEERLWGVVAPLWSLWSVARPEPHLGHLGRLAESIDRHGGKVVVTLPLLASFLGSPYEPSPYAPVSRCWWNELYLDFAARPELASCPEAVERLGRDGSVGASNRSFDARARYSVVREVLALLADHVERTPGAVRDDLHGFRTGAGVLDYARFRAAVERCEAGWRSWPAAPAEVMAGIGDDSPDVRAHVYAQWAMRRQLDRLAENLGRRNQILGLDLPVGCHADGYDTFVSPELYAAGASVGAPPDEFFGAGQTWGFPPVFVDAARAEGHASFAAAVAGHAAVAGMLRIDHVMQLHRLWWVPDGLGAAEGAYVTQPAEELAAVLAIESHLGACVIVGEDLGTVPDEVRTQLAEHTVAGMYVAQFEQPSWPGAELRDPPRGCVASVGTHDTPPFAAWARALESTRRADRSGGEPGSAGERAAQLDNLVAGFERTGSIEVGRWGRPSADDLASLPSEFVDALHAALVWRLGASDAACVLVALDDLAGVTSPQNVPGTPSDRPNWVMRLPTPLGGLLEGGSAAVLARLQDERLGAWERARRHP